MAGTYDAGHRGSLCPSGAEAEVEWTSSAWGFHKTLNITPSF